jgi:ribA/ribD-fused uncharacterized protein
MKTYNYDDISFFFKTKEEFGALSNFYSGTSMDLTDPEVYIQTSEHLYQALRFQDDLDIQKQALTMNSAFLMKQFVYSKKDHFIDNWQLHSKDIMCFTIALKLFLHYELLSTLLSKAKQEIVEVSYRDNFWGAIPVRNTNSLVVDNTLGCIWMEFRSYTQEELLRYLKTPNPNLENIKLLNIPLHQITF